MFISMAFCPAFSLIVFQILFFDCHYLRDLFLLKTGHRGAQTILSDSLLPIRDDFYIALFPNSCFLFPLFNFEVPLFGFMAKKLPVSQLEQFWVDSPLPIRNDFQKRYPASYFLFPISFFQF